MDYETLDTIADSYIPILAILVIASLINVANNSRTQLLRQIGIIVYSIFIVYGVMYIDQQLTLWGRFGLDYSTHTAAAFALVNVLLIATPKYRTLLLSFLVYCALMLYQRYHTISDILSTIVVMVLLIQLPLRLLDRTGLRNRQ